MIYFYINLRERKKGRERKRERERERKRERERERERENYKRCTSKKRDCYLEIYFSTPTKCVGLLRNSNYYIHVISIFEKQTRIIK